MIRSFNDLLDALRGTPPVAMVMAGAQEREALLAASEAASLGVANGFLVGDESGIRRVADENGIDISSFTVIHEPEPKVQARKAGQVCKESGAGVLIKGTVSSSDFLRTVLDKELGFVEAPLLSHVGLIEAEGYDRLFLLTDGAMNIAPTLEQKAAIVRNAVALANALGNDSPRVAVLAAVETVNPKMTATTDAAELAAMCARGEFGSALVEGPFAMDNAVSVKAAEMKGIASPVAGRADVLLAPDIEAGNVIYKTMVYFGRVKAAGLVLGASIPVALNSRSDTHENRLLSLALASYVSGRMRG